MEYSLRHEVLTKYTFFVQKYRHSTFNFFCNTSRYLCCFVDFHRQSNEWGLSPQIHLSIFLCIGFGGIRTCVHSSLCPDNGTHTPSDRTCFLSTHTDIHHRTYTSCFFCSWLWVWFVLLMYRSMQNRILMTHDKMDVQNRHCLCWVHFVLPLPGMSSLTWFLGSGWPPHLSGTVWRWRRQIWQQ